MSDSAWAHVNRRLVAKSIGELAYEQALAPLALEKPGAWELPLKSGARYRFRAWRGIWDHLRVEPGSLVRESGDGRSAPVDCAGTFFIDSREETGMSEITLGNYLEEMNATLHADLELERRRAGLSSRELCLWSGERIQAVLDGHPKLLLNKGRLGWSASDRGRYAPECAEPFRLEWLAVRRDAALASFGEGIDLEALERECLDDGERAALRARLAELVPAPESYLFLPVHPWQWDSVIRLQFQAELVSGALVHLGEAGDRYLPQISLRTLTNVSRPGRADLKLPLSVLNTSAVRGIPPRYVAIAPGLSAALARLVSRDPELAASGCGVLADLAGVSVENPLYRELPGSPYRYREQLGAIWRESPASKLGAGEQAVLSGALAHQDAEGRSLIGAFIERSGLSAREWLAAYFRATVIPLYHLQRAYGIGLVAHGQNVVVRLKDARPVGVFLKDFQGDLRLSSSRPAEQERVLGELAARLDRLPPNYLIHDLVTGHFVTVLRFVSEAMRESDGLDEREFYACLARELEAYLARTGPLSEQERAEGLDLLAPRLARVLVNRVRFKIGYGDSAERPLPLVGTELENPLFLARNPAPAGAPQVSREDRKA